MSTKYAVVTIEQSGVRINRDGVIQQWSNIVLLAESMARTLDESERLGQMLAQIRSVLSTANIDEEEALKRIRAITG